MYYRSWRTWIFLLYVSMVLYGSTQQGNNISWLSQLWKYDKLVHYLEYLGMGFLLINALKIHPLKQSQWKLSILFLLLFPIVDEMLQHFTPNRIPDILDVIADYCGGLTGAYLRKYI